MRLITLKHTGGTKLNNAHQHPPTSDEKATSRWHSFNDKEFVKDSLLEEQFGLCCYSELRADLEGIGYHIEHIEPKSKYPLRTFDYLNLAASALSSADLENRAKNDVFGGHAKNNDYDPSLFISCHDKDCARYFSYLSDGRVVPNDKLSDSEKKQANYTITLLNLNSPYLVNRRKNWYDELDALFEEHADKGWSLEHLASIDLVPTKQKRISQFFSLTRQFFGNVAEQVLTQHAPELA